MSSWRYWTTPLSGARARSFRSFISPTDPVSRWTGANTGLAFFAYSTNYLIDLAHAVIVDVEETTAVRQAEVGAARTMIERVKDRYDLWPARFAADTAYGSAEMLDWLVHERRIEPHIPVIDKSGREDGTFSRSDFAFDRTRDQYTCTASKTLKPRQRTGQVTRESFRCPCQVGRPCRSLAQFSNPRPTQRLWNCFVLSRLLGFALPLKTRPHGQAICL